MIMAGSFKPMLRAKRGLIGRNKLIGPFDRFLCWVTQTGTNYFPSVDMEKGLLYLTKKKKSRELWS